MFGLQQLQRKRAYGFGCYFGALAKQMSKHPRVNRKEFNVVLVEVLVASLYIDVFVNEMKQRWPANKWGVVIDGVLDGAADTLSPDRSTAHVLRRTLVNRLALLNEAMLLMVAQSEPAHLNKCMIGCVGSARFDLSLEDFVPISHLELMQEQGVLSEHGQDLLLQWKSNTKYVNVDMSHESQEWAVVLYCSSKEIIEKYTRQAGVFG